MILKPLVLFTLAFGIVLPTDVTVRAGEPASTLASPKAEAKAPAKAKGEERAECVSDPELIADLGRTREALEAKVKELLAKEAEIQAREQALNEQLKQLEVLRDEIAQIDATKKKENQEKVNKLIETVEAMSPKAAAKLISTIDERLAVATMKGLTTQRLGKIMNLMEPGPSSRLSELLAGVARAKGSERAVAGTQNGAQSAPGTTSKQ